MPITYRKVKTLKLLFVLSCVFCLSSCTKDVVATIPFQVFYSNQDNISITNIDNTDFKQLQSEKISYKNGWHWFKVTLDDQNTSKENLVFHIQEPSLNSIYIYNVKKELIKQQQLTNHSFQIPSTAKTYFIKAFFKRQVHFPLKIYDTQDYQKITQQENIGFGLYYGLAIMVFIFNFIFYFSLKDITFLYYCLFLASINISFTGFDGVLALSFPEEILDTTVIIFHFLIQVFGALFASNFLGLQNFYPKLNKLGFVLLSFPAVFYVLFFGTNHFLYVAIADALGLLLLSFYWVLGIVMIQKETFAKFFVIGYSMVLFAGIFFLVPLNFGISSVSVSFLQLKTGALFEMLVLTFATIYRVKLLQEENVRFSSEIKQHIQQIFALETKIKEATSVEEKNIQIETKIQQIAEQFELTARESDLLIQILNGLDNKQIAEKLFISVNTVKYHTRNIYEKLDVKKRGEVISKVLFDS